MSSEIIPSNNDKVIKPKREKVILVCFTPSFQLTLSRLGHYGIAEKQIQIITLSGHTLYIEAKALKTQEVVSEETKKRKRDVADAQVYNPAANFKAFFEFFRECAVRSVLRFGVDVKVTVVYKDVINERSRSNVIHGLDETTSMLTRDVDIEAAAEEKRSSSIKKLKSATKTLIDNLKNALDYIGGIDNGLENNVVLSGADAVMSELRKRVEEKKKEDGVKFFLSKITEEKKNELIDAFVKLVTNFPEVTALSSPDDVPLLHYAAEKDGFKIVHLEFGRILGNTLDMKLFKVTPTTNVKEYNKAIICARDTYKRLKKQYNIPSLASFTLRSASSQTELSVVREYGLAYFKLKIPVSVSVSDSVSDSSSSNNSVNMDVDMDVDCVN